VGVLRQHPELWLKDAFRAILLVFRNKAAPLPTRQQQARAVYLRAYARVVESGERGSSLTGHRSGVGSYNKDFAGKWKKVLEATCGRDGAKLAAVNSALAASQLLESANKELGVAIGKIGAGKQPLALYRCVRQHRRGSCFNPYPFKLYPAGSAPAVLPPARQPMARGL
jgi:hypothetical protein